MKEMHFYSNQVVGLFFLFSSFFVVAQETPDIAILNNTNTFLNTTIPQMVNENTIVTGNFIQIQQQGQENVATVNVTSNSSSITIDQDGFGNSIFAVYDASSITSSILQSGANNSVIDIAINPASQEINTNVTQTGENLNLIKFGANSISNRIRINMSGTDRSIIMTSF